MSHPNTPLISVVTVCLNDLPNLRLTAQSVSGQDFQEYEHVVWDGGSADGTPEALPAMGLSCFRSQPDQGIFDAMNKALALCQGEFICFLNAGDTFHSPTVLSQMAALFEKHPEVRFFYGDVYFPGSLRPFSIQPSRLTPFLLFRGTVCHQAWFVHRSVYQALGGFDLSLRFKGDYDALLRMVYQERVTYLHVPVCVATYLGGGYSERTFQASRAEFEQVRRRYISRNQARLFCLLLWGANFLRSSQHYQRLMAWVSRMRAKRSWTV